LLVTIYSDNEQAVAVTAKKVKEKLRKGVRSLGAEVCAVLPNKREHFGFRDGLSNPEIAGAPPPDPKSHRSPRKATGF
jgi:deferrochelatase/peroxidase EfeB